MVARWNIGIGHFHWYMVLVGKHENMKSKRIYFILNHTFS